MKVSSLRLLTPLFICAAFLGLHSGRAYANGAAIEINDCVELQKIGNDVGYPLSGSYVLGNDFSCGATIPTDPGNAASPWTDGKGFVPIGANSGSPFTGTFDGNNHTIDNLNIIRADDNPGLDNGTINSGADYQYVGLFGYSQNATIKNLNLDYARVKGYWDVGGIVGFAEYTTLTNLTVNKDFSPAAYNNSSNLNYFVWARYGERGGGIAGTMFGGTLTNSETGGNVKGSGIIIGGLVGSANSSTVISGSSSSAVIDGGYSVGGLVGEANSIAISDSVASGDVYTVYEWDYSKPGNFGGGLVGYIAGSTITDSSASGDVSGYEYIGGLIGILSFTEAGVTTISSSHASGNVSGWRGVGGFVGSATEAQFDTSYATGDVTATDDEVGGFAGRAFCSTAFTNTYATGTVNAGGFSVGGFVGTDTAPCGLPSYTNVYATGAVSGSSMVGGLIGSASGSQLNQAYATGLVEAVSDDAGGLIGTASGDISATQSFATGAVSSTNGSNVGGFIGSTQSIGTVITDSYARGAVSGPAIVGGFIGFSTGGTSITNAYATGLITSPGQFAGFLGAGEEGTVVQYSFWDTDSTGTTQGTDGVGKTTAEMQDITTYTTALGDNAWDFNTVWGFDPSGYPCLQWSDTQFCLGSEAGANSVKFISPLTGKGIEIQMPTQCSFEARFKSETDMGAPNDVAYDYPNGLVGFGADCGTVGYSATVIEIYAGVSPGSAIVRKYNPTTKTYFTLSDALIESITYEGQPATRVTFQVTDGSERDADGVADGKISDPAGLAVQALGVPNTGLGSSRQ